MLRAAKMVLTCRPCSGATPTGNKRGISRSTTRHLDGDTWPGAEITLDCSLNGADEDAIGAAPTISMQHGATSSTTGSVSPPAASGWTSPPAAKKTAAGAMTAARTADDFHFRRCVTNSCRPTDSTLRGTREMDSNLSEIRWVAGGQCGPGSRRIACPWLSRRRGLHPTQSGQISAAQRPCHLLNWSARALPRCRRRTRRRRVACVPVATEKTILSQGRGKRSSPRHSTSIPPRCAHTGRSV